MIPDVRHHDSSQYVGVGGPDLSPGGSVKTDILGLVQGERERSCPESEFVGAPGPFTVPTTATNTDSCKKRNYRYKEFHTRSLKFGKFIVVRRQQTE